jgi:hypothetical protein
VDEHWRAKALNAMNDLYMYALYRQIAAPDVHLQITYMSTDQLVPPAVPSAKGARRNSFGYLINLVKVRGFCLFDEGDNQSSVI